MKSALIIMTLALIGLIGHQTLQFARAAEMMSKTSSVESAADVAK